MHGTGGLFTQLLPRADCERADVVEHQQGASRLYNESTQPLPVRTLRSESQRQILPIDHHRARLHCSTAHCERSLDAAQPTRHGMCLKLVMRIPIQVICRLARRMRSCSQSLDLAALHVPVSCVAFGLSPCHHGQCAICDVLRRLPCITFRMPVVCMSIRRDSCVTVRHCHPLSSQLI